MGADLSRDSFKPICSLSVSQKVNKSATMPPVWSISIATNARQLATTCESLINIWCLDQYRVVQTLTGHGDAVWCVKYSPNEELLISSSADGTIRVWDAASGNAINVMRGHTSWVWALSWSPDSETFASGGTDSRICVWHVEGLSAMSTWQSHSKSVSGVSMTSALGSAKLLSCSADGTLAVWDASKREGHSSAVLDYRLSGHVGGVSAIEICPSDDHLIATGGDDSTVRIWNLRDCYTYDNAGSNKKRNGGDRGINIPHHILTGHTETVWTLAFTHDGKLLASGSSDRSIRVWKSDEHQPYLITTFNAHESWVRCLAWSADNSFLASSSTDGFVSLWAAPRKFHAEGARGVGRLSQREEVKKMNKSFSETAKTWITKARACLGSQEHEAEGQQRQVEEDD